MKFPWSKPSACEVVEALFDEFTPEERKILDGDDCAIPHMRSFLLEEVRSWKSNYSLEDAKSKMKHLFFPLGDKIHDTEIQRQIGFFFITDLLYCR